MTNTPQMTELEAKEFLIQTYYDSYVEPYDEDHNGNQTLEDVEVNFEDNPAAIVTAIDTHYAMEISKARYAFENPESTGETMREGVLEKAGATLPPKFKQSTDAIIQDASQTLKKASEIRLQISKAAELLNIDYSPFGGGKPQLIN